MVLSCPSHQSEYILIPYVMTVRKTVIVSYLTQKHEGKLARLDDHLVDVEGYARHAVGLLHVDLITLGHVL